jgi:carbon-monoxide dehydrogenase medium subunit
VRDFEFLKPTTVAEASEMLGEHGEDCRVIAGGTALMLALRQRIVNPTHLISLGRIEATRGIDYEKNRGLRIGARTMHAEVAASPIIRQHCPLLADMAARVANPQVRNQGTIGGNLCYADPATDPPSCLMALDARVVLANSQRERALTIEEFLVDYYATALESDEIVTEIRVPPVNYTAGRYIRHLRSAAEHRPMINLAVTLNHEADLCKDVRLVVGATTPVPRRVTRCEDYLRGRVMTSALIVEAAEIVAGDINCISDIRGSEDYRRTVVGVIVRRTLAEVFGHGADEA